jgi:phage-related protein
VSRTVKFYKKRNEECPVRIFLDSLSGKVAQKVAWVLSLIEELDSIPQKFFKKLVNTNIWECRIKYASDIYRILCFLHKNSVVVLTNGFQKKSQKTPKEEIKLAEEYRKDYLERCKNE